MKKKLASRLVLISAGPGIGYLFPLGDGNATLDIGAEFHNIFLDPENLRYFGVSLGAVLSLITE